MTQRTDLSTLERSIKCDRTISEGQLWRHHGLTLRDLGKRFVQNQIVIERSSGANTAHKIVMVSVEELREPIYSLRHAAGLAEMRHMLKVETDAWLTERRFEQSTLPDAIWVRGEQNRVAIEYDICNLSFPLICIKVARFRLYHDQIWGTVSRSRITTLRNHFGNLCISPQILQAKWW